MPLLIIISSVYQNKQILMKKQKRTVSVGKVGSVKKHHHQDAQSRKHLIQLDSTIYSSYLIPSKQHGRVKSASKGLNSQRKSINKTVKQTKARKQLLEINNEDSNPLRLCNNKKQANFSKVDYSLECDQNFYSKSSRNPNSKQANLKVKQKTKKGNKNSCKPKSSRIAPIELQQLSYNNTYHRPNPSEILQMNYESEIVQRSQQKETTGKSQMINQLRKINEELRQNLLLVTKKHDNDRIAQMQEKHYIELEKVHFQTSTRIKQKQMEITNLQNKIKCQEKLRHQIQSQKQLLLEKQQELQRQRKSFHARIQSLQRKNQVQVEQMKVQNKELQIQKMQALVLRQKQKKAMEELQKKFKESSLKNVSYEKELKKLTNDLVDIKSEMNQIINENLELRERQKSHKEQKKYLKDNLYSVLNVIRSNLKACEKQKKVGMEEHLTKNVLCEQN